MLELQSSLGKAAGQQGTGTLSQCIYLWLMMIVGLTDKFKPDSSFLNTVSDQITKTTFHHYAWYAITEPSSSSLFYKVLHSPEIPDHI